MDQNKQTTQYRTMQYMSNDKWKGIFSHSNVSRNKNYFLPGNLDVGDEYIQLDLSEGENKV